MDIIARRPRPSVQEVFATDRNPAPAVLRQESPAHWQGSADVSAERYFSPEWHAREVEKIWRRTWQFACRVEELPNVGDQIVYDIVDDSILVVRTADDTIKAYVNSCLHRGTMLRTDAGNARQIRCPFHGWTWTLDGKLSVLPGQWDFPHVDKAKFCLPEVRVGQWGRVRLRQSRCAGGGFRQLSGKPSRAFRRLPARGSLQGCACREGHAVQLETGHGSVRRSLSRAVRASAGHRLLRRHQHPI